MTPAEIVAQRGAGIITTDEMMDTLLSRSYTFGSVAYVDGIATDAYISGDWDGICMAFYRGELTDDEFQRIADYAQHQASAIPADRRDAPPVPPDVVEHEQVTRRVARLLATAYDSEGVATGLGITDSQVAAEASGPRTVGNCGRLVVAIPGMPVRYRRNVAAADPASTRLVASTFSIASGSASNSGRWLPAHLAASPV